MCFISGSLMENYVSFPFKRCIRLIRSWIKLSMLENLLTPHIKISSVKLHVGYNNQSFKTKKRYYWDVFSTSDTPENEMLIPTVKWGCYTRLNSGFDEARLVKSWNCIHQHQRKQQTAGLFQPHLAYSEVQKALATASRRALDTNSV